MLALSEKDRAFSSHLPSDRLYLNLVYMAAVNRRRLLLLLLLLLRRRRRSSRQQRRQWVRTIFQSRRTKGEFHALIAEMRLKDHESFYKYFHMTPQRFSHLLSLEGPSIKRQDTRLREAIPPDERLAITLRYLVTGDSMQTISFSHRVGHSTVSGIIDATCDALWRVLTPEYMRRPTSAEEWRRVSDGFCHMWNFPHCIGIY